RSAGGWTSWPRSMRRPCDESFPSVMPRDRAGSGGSPRRGGGAHRPADALAKYRSAEGLVPDLRRAPPPEVDSALARSQLASRLADLRSRIMSFGLSASPLGAIII